jgi:hypothetical protein
MNNLNIPNDHLLLINILNTMYNDNLRQINSLTSSNNEIRTIITNLLSNNTNSYSNRGQTHNRFRNRNHNYRDNLSRNSNQGRLYINNLPYIIEDIREYRIPSSQLYNWINNSNASSSESQARNNNQATNNNQERTSNFSRAFQSFFEPVEVFPTQTQIETATRRAMYCDIVSPLNRSCPISLENFNDSETVSVIRYCGHIFHTEHLNRWFRTNCRCPVCRYDIRNYTSSSSSNFTPAISTQSRPLNESQNNVPLENEERRIPINQINSTGMQNTNPYPYINNILNNFVNDISLQDIENIGSIFTDSSGNFTDSSGNFMSNISDSSVFFNLLSSLNNRNAR